MAELERLIIRLEADTERMRRQMAASGRTVENFERRTTRHLSSIDRAMVGLGRSAVRMASALAAALVVREAVTLADDWTELTNAMRQYEDVLGPVTGASERLVDVAMDARAPLEAMSQLMQAGSRSARELGRGGDDVFAFMEAAQRSKASGGGAVALPR